jgi:hypothetical protein
MMFNEASASSSPIWMVGMVDSIVGDSNVALVGKLCLGDEHNVNVAQGKKCLPRETEVERQ